uniref:Putative keratin-associated protein n=1 Tax=Desmodus rotundus TaxID=9430 RepID=K9IW45_DESRO
MSCCSSSTEWCCSIPSGSATTICCSNKCCWYRVCLSSASPHQISLLKLACCVPCPPSCWLLSSCHLPLQLSGISLMTHTQSCCEGSCESRC